MAVFDLTEVANPSELEAGIKGPGAMNRLFIYTGIAKVVAFDGNLDNDFLQTGTVRLNLSLLHGRFFATGGAQVTQAKAVAGLASLHGNDDAINLTWAVSAVRVDVDSGGAVILAADVAAQGASGN